MMMGNLLENFISIFCVSCIDIVWLVDEQSYYLNETICSLIFHFY